MTRTYGLSCPVARALDCVGDRWTLLIIRDLLLSKACRFQELHTSLEGITPSLLSARLKSLEAMCLIDHRLYSSHPPRLEYFLTVRGQTLGPVLKSLYSFGETLPAPESK